MLHLIDDHEGLSAESSMCPQCSGNAESLCVYKSHSLRYTEITNALSTSSFLELRIQIRLQRARKIASPGPHHHLRIHS